MRILYERRGIVRSHVLPLPAMDRVELPLPSLHWYAAFSGLSLFYVLMYGITSPAGLLSSLWNDLWCLAAMLNMGCCCLFLLASFIQSVVFGKLQLVEMQHMRDKFWNFVFYKFIFVFGVLNVQEMPEMMCWCVWFSLLGTLLLTEQLCKDRFQLLSFSPHTVASTHAKIIVLLVTVFLACSGLFMVAAIVGWQYGFSHFTFLYSEVFVLFARTMHTIIRYVIHLWDMHHDGTWENRSTYTYYAELVLELAALSVEFLHHVHMLMWANMLLSVASLILLMKLRFLYQEIQRRLRRHRNYMLVSQTLENRFVMVPQDELSASDDVCAICWERMNTARRLPCRHMFHTGCLRLWLEQDTVCPTCRLSLSTELQTEDRRGGEERGGEEGGEGMRGRWRRFRRHRNWLLHFNGASIASWLPTFSVELHDDGLIGQDIADLHRGAQQVHTMFPHVPLQAITLDLADTRSISITVEHILNNAIYIPGTSETPPLTSTTPTISTPGTPSQSLESQAPSPPFPNISDDTLHLESTTGPEQSVLRRRHGNMEEGTETQSSSNLEQVRHNQSVNSLSQESTACSEDVMSFLSLQRRKRDLLASAKQSYMQKNQLL